MKNIIILALSGLLVFSATLSVLLARKAQTLEAEIKQLKDNPVIQTVEVGDLEMMTLQNETKQVVKDLRADLFGYKQAYSELKKDFDKLSRVYLDREKRDKEIDEFLRAMRDFQVGVQRVKNYSEAQIVIGAFARMKIP